MGSTCWLQTGKFAVIAKRKKKKRELRELSVEWHRCKGCTAARCLLACSLLCAQGQQAGDAERRDRSPVAWEYITVTQLCPHSALELMAPWSQTLCQPLDPLLRGSGLAPCWARTMFLSPQEKLLSKHCSLNSITFAERILEGALQNELFHNLCVYVALNWGSGSQTFKWHWHTFSRIPGNALRKILNKIPCSHGPVPQSRGCTSKSPSYPGLKRQKQETGNKLVEFHYLGLSYILRKKGKFSFS